MKKSITLTWCACILSCWSAEPVDLSAQRSDAIYPVRRTDAEVRRHTVRITLEPPMYSTESVLTLYNPKSEPETLTLAVPLVEDVIFTEHAVRLDGRPLAWRYLTINSLVRDILPQMKHAFLQMLENDPPLRNRLEASLQTYRQVMEKNPFPEEATLLAVAPLHRVYPYDALQMQPQYMRYGDISTVTFVIYKAIELGEPVDAEALMWLLEQKNIRQALPAGRWGEYQWLNPRSGALAQPLPYAIQRLTLLLFEITLQPRQTHTLSVHYRHPLPYHQPFERLPEVYSLPHFAPRNGWAKYNGLELTVSVPDSWSAKSRPAWSESRVEGRRRLYQATLPNPPACIYLAVGTRAAMESAPLYALVAPREPLQLQRHLMNVRIINGQPYIACRKEELGSAMWMVYEAEIQLRDNQQIWQWKREYVGAPLSLTIHLNQPKFVVNGKTYALSRAPLKHEGEYYITARDALYISAVLQNALPNRGDADDPLYRFILDKAREGVQKIPLIYDEQNGAFVLDLTGVPSQ